MVNYAINKAWKILLYNNIKSLPFEIKKIQSIYYFNFIVLEYEKNKNLAYVLDKKNKHLLNTSWSFIYKNCFIIFYSKRQSTQQFRYRLAREIAIFIFKDISFSKKILKILSNIFAIQLLMPTCVVEEFEYINASKLAKIFCTSPILAIMALLHLKKFKPNEENKALANKLRLQFRDFIKYNVS